MNIEYGRMLSNYEFGMIDADGDNHGPTIIGWTLLIAGLSCVMSFVCRLVIVPLCSFIYLL